MRRPVNKVQAQPKLKFPASESVGNISMNKFANQSVKRSRPKETSQMANHLKHTYSRGGLRDKSRDFPRKRDPSIKFPGTSRNMQHTTRENVGFSLFGFKDIL